MCTVQKVINITCALEIHVIMWCACINTYNFLHTDIWSWKMWVQYMNIQWLRKVKIITVTLEWASDMGSSCGTTGTISSWLLTKDVSLLEPRYFLFFTHFCVVRRVCDNVLKAQNMECIKVFFLSKYEKCSWHQDYLCVFFVSLPWNVLVQLRFFTCFVRFMIDNYCLLEFSYLFMLIY